MSVDENGVIVNTYRPGTFTASKLWDGEPGTEVTLTLYRTVLNDTYTPPYREYVDTATPTGVALEPAEVSGEYQPWTYTWFNLPANGEITRLINNVPVHQTMSFEMRLRRRRCPRPRALPLSTASNCRRRATPCHGASCSLSCSP